MQNRIKLISWAISYLYAKRTKWLLLVEAEKAKQGGMYPPPTVEEVEIFKAESEEAGMPLDTHMVEPLPKQARRHYERLIRI